MFGLTSLKPGKRVCLEMLATGNLPGLTAPAEGARDVGCLMESVLSFRSKKVAEKAEAELPVVSHRLLGNRLPLELPLQAGNLLQTAPSPSSNDRDAARKAL